MTRRTLALATLVLAAMTVSACASSHSSGGGGVAGGPLGSSPFYPVHTMWDDLAGCESTWRWDIDSGNGFYGGLQFTLPTWHAYGGGEFAYYPNHASRHQQIEIGERLFAARGTTRYDWPSCSHSLGLP